MNEFNFEYTEIFPNIFLYNDVIKNPNSFIALCEDFDSWSDGKIISSAGSDVFDSNFRIAKSMSLPISFTTPTEWFDIAKTIWNYANHYALTNKIEFSEMEQLRIVKYPEHGGKYDEHYDSCPSAPRIFSCVLYLNDVKSGGETAFPKFNFEVKPQAGSIVFFPSNYAYLHQSKPCNGEKKYIVVTQFKEKLEI